MGCSLSLDWHLLGELSGGWGVVRCYCGGGLLICVCYIGRMFAVGCWEFFIIVVVNQSFVDCIS